MTNKNESILLKKYKEDLKKYKEREKELEDLLFNKSYYRNVAKSRPKDLEELGQLKEIIKTKKQWIKSLQID